MNSYPPDYDDDRPEASWDDAPPSEETLEECPYCGSYLDYIDGHLVCGQCELYWPDLAALQADAADPAGAGGAQ